MCGIAAILSEDPKLIARFCGEAIELLQKRGPDSQNIWQSSEAGLAHSRLAILDLTETGNQPMISSSGRFIISYNGEIYNHLDLREKFFRGKNWTGHSDTETLISLYELLGSNMLPELVGMWAIAIWDTYEKKLFLSRDRYGQKPLYYTKQQGNWLIASEMKVLIPFLEDVKLNETAVTEYLALGNYGHLGNQTFYENIHQLLPGTFAIIKPEEDVIQSQSYWKLPNIAYKDQLVFDDTIKKRLHDLIVEAVLSQTLSDVPIGMTLSGGIDSSIIAGILGKYYSGDVRIFTAQTPGHQLDESQYVNEVVRHLPQNRFKLEKLLLDNYSLEGALDKVIQIQEEPFGDPSVMAHSHLMEMASKAKIKVVLGGQGADELFFGYNNMIQAILTSQFRAGEWKKVLENIKNGQLGNSLIFRSLFCMLFPKLERQVRIQSRIKRRSFLNTSLTDVAEKEPMLFANYSRPFEVLQESINGVHLPHLLHYDDRNGMAFSIEGRMPFLDHRILEFVAGIRWSEHFRFGARKTLLREACKDYLPEMIYNRRDKIGFFTPLHHMIAGEKEFISKTTSKFISNKLQAHTPLVQFRLLSVSLWQNRFNVIR